MRTRIVPTASGKKAIQVVSKRQGKVTIYKHIGTFSNSEEKANLLKKAEKFIEATFGQTNFFNLVSSVRPSEIIITQSKPQFLYELLSNIYDKLGLGSFPDLLIKDLVIARVYQPASKLETTEILTDSFGKDYALKTVYRHLKQGLEKGLKENFQKALIDFARVDLGDSLKLVFYDVTTLYFESHLKTTLKDFGFSKDHRSAETQIVIGLVVSQKGLPLYFEVFSGKTFEGNTFIAVVKNIQKLLNTNKLVVVADSAMISKNNMDRLDKESIGFVVGARIANMPFRLTEYISDKLHGINSKTVFIKNYLGYHLICDYSLKRAAKDRSDREKQIIRAESLITSPAKVVSRFKFVKANGSTISLNEELVEKARKLEGIKGYLTNTSLPKKTVIDRYHDLWMIENSFRITKNDLEARPIFHRLDSTIKAHAVIVFAGLAISRHLEIKTGMSLKKVLKLAGKILTHKVTNIKTGEIAYIETTIEDPELKEKIDLLKSLGH